jgi:hypothetical protein
LISPWSMLALKLRGHYLQGHTLKGKRKYFASRWTMRDTSLAAGHRRDGFNAALPAGRFPFGFPFGIGRAIRSSARQDDTNQKCNCQ